MGVRSRVGPDIGPGVRLGTVGVQDTRFPGQLVFREVGF